MAARTKQPGPWEAAFAIPVVRGSLPAYPPEDLEPGVKFFVLMLEQLGAVTHFSCEGHPRGFYILFEALEATARAIVCCGYLTVELERRPGFYRLSLVHHENNHGPTMSETDRARILGSAARAWVKAFGPLKKTARKPPEGT